MIRLPANLAALAMLTRKDHPRYAMNALRVQETNDGYQVVVTDGRRVAVVTGIGRDDEPTPALSQAPSDAWTALVPASEWRRILKTGKRHPVACVLAEKVTTFALGGDVSTVPNVEGRFPNVEDLAAAQRSIIRVQVDPNLLADLLLVAALFSREHNAGKAQVTLHLRSKDCPLLITTSNATQEFQAAIMPLT